MNAHYHVCRVRVDWKSETYRRHVCLTEEKGEGVLIVERRGGGRGKGGQIRESREKKGGRDCNLLNLAAKRDS